MAFVVDSVKEAPVLHVPLRVALEDASLLLELYDGDGLVHLGRQLQRLVVHARVWLQQSRYKLLAGVVGVDVEGEGGQWHEVDAILLDGGQVGVAQAEAQHVADAGVVAGGGPHPEYVVVAPLYVPGVVLAQGVHNLVGSRAAVVDVAEDVELVDGEPLYDVTDGADEVVGASGGDDGVDDDADVGSLVLVVAALVEQLLDDVGEVLWQRLAHLGACVLR